MTIRDVDDFINDMGNETRYPMSECEMLLAKERMLREYLLRHFESEVGTDMSRVLEAFMCGNYFIDVDRLIPYFARCDALNKIKKHLLEQGQNCYNPHFPNTWRGYE
jgi:hypothetical protein